MVIGGVNVVMWVAFEISVCNLKREGLLLLSCPKPDPPLGRHRCWLEEFFDGLENDLEFFVVLIVLAFQGFDLVRQVLVSNHCLPQLDECAHDEDVDLNRALAI